MKENLYCPRTRLITLVSALIEPLVHASPWPQCPLSLTSSPFAILTICQFCPRVTASGPEVQKRGRNREVWWRCGGRVWTGLSSARALSLTWVISGSCLQGGARLQVPPSQLSAGSQACHRRFHRTAVDVLGVDSRCYWHVTCGFSLCELGFGPTQWNGKVSKREHPFW